ncbi:unnamed protein product, partial [Mesorhabditis belari]|uniref:GB1/RHD3-type G domain-containing protein n=1 Tax=Mesorhabditis belari TaxID=2138241 RepID=A0AAF3FHA1_9BILA
MSLKLLFNIDSNNQPNFDQDLIREIGRQIGDRPVAVVSTVGGFREGKSFFDNILLKGLQNGGNVEFEPNDVIGGPNGVAFKRGIQRHTVGIQIWDKVFYRTNSRGIEIAVLLIDTQGTFDTESHMKNSAIIFMITLMISSNLVFNKMKLLNAHDLADLNVFIEMSRNGGEPMGQSLLFLMRDWQGDGDGGMWPEYLKEIRSSSAKAADLKGMLEGIFGAFHKVECWTVFPPNAAVRKADGSIKAGDCDAEFLRNLCSCANHILRNLEPKKVLGTALDGATLETYILEVVKHVRENSAICMNNALEATSRLCFQEAKNKAIQHFDTDIATIKKQADEKGIDESSLVTRLSQIKTIALKVYDKRPLFGSIPEKTRRRSELETELKAKCDALIAWNGDRVRLQIEREQQQRKVEAMRIENEQQQRKAEAERQQRLREGQLREQAERAQQEERQRREKAERERVEEQRLREQAERARLEDQQRRDRERQEEQRREQENQRRLEEQMMALQIQALQSRQLGGMQVPWERAGHSSPTNNYFYGNAGMGGMGSSGNVGQGHSCNCRTGCRHGNCGCRRRGVECNAGCGCGSDCVN